MPQPLDPASLLISQAPKHEPLSVEDQQALGRRRIVNILTTHRVCSGRTLENKIADAGPSGMRVDPHIITTALHQLLQSGAARCIKTQTVSTGPAAQWYTLSSTTQAEIDLRLGELEPIQRAFAESGFVSRVGQALEIATYRAPASISALDLLGNFSDLDRHADDTNYRKEEPPSAWRGNRYPSGKLDFIVVGKHSTIAGGVEVKNTRAWIYPEHGDVRDLLKKCCALDLVPILIARRIHYTTTRLLLPRGGIVSEVYNQRLPESDASLAERARHKNLLGYHDILLGNQPDARMLKLAQKLASLLPEARRKLESGGREQLDAFARRRT